MSNGIFGAEKRPIVTIVMDGIGICNREVGNAIKAADTPTLDMLAEKYSDCDVLLQNGGQPVYHYLISVE